MADVTRNVFRGTHVRFLPGMALAGVLCFLAASISSAGGIGRGGLFVPVLKVVGCLDLRTASGFSAFMLTGGSVANVACRLFVKSPRLGNWCPIDYNIALLSEPCMGVIGNLVFPEWLITALFAVFVGWSAFATCRSGIWLWKIESEEGKGIARLGKGNEDGNGIEDGKEPLVLDLEMQSREGCEGDKFPWTRVGVLIVVWFSFFLVYLLRGNQYGQDSSGSGPTNRLVFQAMALASGLLSGIFGIGGGMLISPLLLQGRFLPETTMSAIQYVLLGMDGIEIPLAFSLTCSVSSNIGIMMVQRATEKFGRASLIVFSVSVVMALGMILITGYGSIIVWNDYVSGRYMGFKSPC